jgi:hypothetical protein
VSAGVSALETLDDVVVKEMENETEKAVMMSRDACKWRA